VLSGLGYLDTGSSTAGITESTDDAYVNGDVVQVESSEIPGTVIALNADDTQLVHAAVPAWKLDRRMQRSPSQCGSGSGPRRTPVRACSRRTRNACPDRPAGTGRTDCDDDLKRRGGLIADGAIFR